MCVNTLKRRGYGLGAVYVSSNIQILTLLLFANPPLSRVHVCTCVLLHGQNYTFLRGIINVIYQQPWWMRCACDWQSYSSPHNVNAMALAVDRYGVRHVCVLWYIRDI